ncbi:hypothetical protein BDW74DRAFT_186933 [Aspergillus multicolor]|uniref:uncharacterized protein n=1 Tax=Aspergillus multicolor TaxID=41759 RepID=UPI003CCE1322
MSAEQFLADAEHGAMSVDCHEHVLRIAFIYMDEGLWNGNGVFDVVEKLHGCGWSFGEGELRFNRTLDIFYLTQLAAAIYRASDQLEGDFPSPDDFQAFYTTHHALLNPSAWRSYYSTEFLTQPTTARFYRLPDLQDLPDSDSPLGQPRQRRCCGHATKFPRWAYTVAGTHRRQSTIPLATFTALALRALETSIARLRATHPSVPPYSETQARFWLRHMGFDFASSGPVLPDAWGADTFGVLVAQGAVDVYAWEAAYSMQRWEGSAGRDVVKPDSDASQWKSEVVWCGEPDGGVGMYAYWRGWEAEVGSEEEVEFLAAVAVEETMGTKLEGGQGLEGLDLALRSHVLLGVMRAAVGTGREREVVMEELERRMVVEGTLHKDKARSWLREALEVMEPYVRGWEGVWPGAEEERGGVLWRILVENGQLFARWQVSPV